MSRSVVGNALNKKRQWTDADDARLLELRLSGKTWAVIAAMLRRSTAGVEGRHRRLIAQNRIGPLPGSH